MVHYFLNHRPTETFCNMSSKGGGPGFSILNALDHYVCYQCIVVGHLFSLILSVWVNATDYFQIDTLVKINKKRNTGYLYCYNYIQHWYATVASICLFLLVPVSTIISGLLYVRLC